MWGGDQSRLVSIVLRSTKRSSPSARRPTKAIIIIRIRTRKAMSQPFALVIDDEPEVANATRYVLKRSGFDVCAAYSAEDGITMARENPPDVVICDVALPGASGVDLLHRLKTNPATAHIPVILMSGAARFECAGMFTFLLKPFDSTALVSAARNALASSGLQNAK